MMPLTESQTFITAIGECEDDDRSASDIANLARGSSRPGSTPMVNPVESVRSEFAVSEERPKGLDNLMIERSVGVDLSELRHMDWLDE
jgi:hypothetical protein